MSVDAAVVSSMLDPFRGMNTELQTKSLSGPDVDDCAAALAEMEALATGATDIMDLSTKLGLSGLYLRFSDAYTRALIAAATPQPGKMPTDEEMLATTLTAYDDAVARLEATNDEVSKQAIPGIQSVIALGRSGVTYPVFLRRMEEEGLTDALQGATVARTGLEMDLGFAQKMRNPSEVAKCEKLDATFDTLASASAFGVPDSFEFSLHRRRIEWDFEPALITRRMLEWRWSKLTDHLIDWLDAHAAFAPFDERWADIDGNQQVTRENIRRTKECEPGRFRARERIVKESFGVDFPELDRHELVGNDIAIGIVSWSDERLDLARATYPHCSPGAVAPAELVARTEELQNGRRWARFPA